MGSFPLMPSGTRHLVRFLAGAGLVHPTLRDAKDGAPGLPANPTLAAFGVEDGAPGFGGCAEKYRLRLE